jgi:hypothetical protein
MRSNLSLLFLLAATCAWPQAEPGQLIEIKPDTVIATVNGQKFTVAEFERITENISANLRNLAGRDPQQFLEQYALALTLSGEAERGGLAKLSPYREQIEKATREILVNAMIAERARQIPVTTEELRKVYDSKRDDYREATVKVIFISRLSFEGDLSGKMKKTVMPAEAYQKALEVAKLAREGKDFVALAKQYSNDPTTADKDADYPHPIRSGAQNIPAEIRKPLFEAAPGDIVGPLEHNSGYYIFRVESRRILPFESAREGIEKQFRAAAVDKRLDEMKKKSSVTLDYKAFWDTFLAANKEASQVQQQNAPGQAK